MAWRFPSFRNIVLGFIGGVFGFQILSLIASTLIPSIPIFKGGISILVMLLGVGIMSLFILGIRYDELKNKENLLFVILIFGMLVATYYFLPKYLPQIFSIDPGFSTAIKHSVGIIFGG